MISVTLSTGILVYCCVVAALLGGCLGSFANCAAGRICEGRSFITGRSCCDACGHTLGLFDLFPVFSWLALKGRCRYCGAKIGIRCPLTEAGFAALSVVTLLKTDLSFLYVRNMALFVCLLLLSLVDLDSFTIPDGALLAAILAWVLYLPFGGQSLVSMGLSLLAGLVYGGGTLLLSLVMDKILGRDTLGGGDIKLFFVMGLYCGLVGGLFCLLLACLLGLAPALMSKNASGESKPIPFGPAIAAAMAVTLLFGAPFIHWYLQLLGL